MSHGPPKRSSPHPQLLLLLHVLISRSSHPVLSQEPERRPDASVPHPHPTDAKVSCSRTPEDPLRPEAPSPTLCTLSPLLPGCQPGLPSIPSLVHAPRWEEGQGAWGELLTQASEVERGGWPALGQPGDPRGQACSELALPSSLRLGDPALFHSMGKLRYLFIPQIFIEHR